MGKYSYDYAELLAESRGWSTNGISSDPLNGIRSILQQRGASESEAIEQIDAMLEIVDDLIGNLSRSRKVERFELLASIYVMCVQLQTKDAEYARKLPHPFVLAASSASGTVQTVNTIQGILSKSKRKSKLRPTLSASVLLAEKIRDALNFPDKEGSAESTLKVVRAARKSKAYQTSIRNGMEYYWYDKVQPTPGARNRKSIKYTPSRPPFPEG